MRMRPLFVLSLVSVLLVLVLSACSPRETPSADTDTTTPASTDSPVATTVDRPEDERTPETEMPDVAQTVETDTPPDAHVVAYVNSLPIDRDSLDRSKEQVLNRYDQLYRQFGMNVYDFLEGAGGRIFELGIEDEALELAITRTLIRYELAQRGAAITSEDAEAEFQVQYIQFLFQMGMTSDEEFQRALASGELPAAMTGGMTYEEFMSYARRAVRQDVELRRLQSLVAGTIEPSDEQLREFFSQNRDQYAQPEKVDASHILVSDRDEAQRLLDELRAGADFAELARQHSGCPSSAQGGSLGLFRRGQMVPAFDEAAFNTPVGEISDLVETSYGYHIIKVHDYQPAQTPSYEDVAAQVLADYKTEEQMERFGAWYDEARPAADIRVVDPILHAFRLWESSVEQGLLAFLKLREDESVDDPYLEFIIGSIYEEMMQNSMAELKQITEDETELNDDQQASVDALEIEIETLRRHAVEAYQAAMEALGGSEEIQRKVDALTLPALPD